MPALKKNQKYRVIIRKGCDMITIAILTTISIWWDMVKLGGKAALWLLKWAIIITAFVGMIIPVFFGTYLTMCFISFVIWTLDIIRATIMKTEPKLDRSPFDFRKNWYRLIGAIDKKAEKQKQKQAAKSNDIYVVRGRDLAKVTAAKPASRPITLDEIILCDVLLDD